MARLRTQLLDRTLAGLDRIAARRGRGAATDQQLTGIEGEEAAYFYLRRKGYTVVARRWTAGNAPGDLDLIAWQAQTLCFFEVKTRTAHDATPAEAAIDEHKRNVLRRLAREYVRQLSVEEAPIVRFDVIGVYLVPGEEREVTHFENAFTGGEGQGEQQRSR